MGRLLRAAETLERSSAAAAEQDHPAAGTAAFLNTYEGAILASIDTYLSRTSTDITTQSQGSSAAGRDGTPILRRRPQPRGPLAVFGYDYFTEHAKAAGLPTPRLLSFAGPWGTGEEYAYEALNFADGSRTFRQITTALSAEYGPVPEVLVSEYLRALQTIGIVEAAGNR
jgi:hypothetical protein